MYATEIPSNTATIKEVISTAIELFLYLKLYSDTHDYAPLQTHYSAELQTAKQTLTTSKNSIEFTYSDFPCHLKVDSDKLASISCLWKCKNGERLSITANSFTKIDQLDKFRPPAVAVRMRKFCPPQEPIRLQDLLNSARSRAEKRINCLIIRYVITYFSDGSRRV